MYTDVSSCCTCTSAWDFDCWRRRDPPWPLWQRWTSVCSEGRPSGSQTPAPGKKRRMFLSYMNYNEKWIRPQTLSMQIYYKIYINNIILTLHDYTCKHILTFISICLFSEFWNKSFTRVLPSSDEPFSWENLYFQMVFCGKADEKYQAEEPDMPKLRMKITPRSHLCSDSHQCARNQYDATERRSVGICTI